MAKRKLPASDADIHVIGERLFESFLKESDRGCVLIAAAALDEALDFVLRQAMRSDEQTLKACVSPLFGTLGPLSSFGAKISLCRALNLIEEWQFQDLQRIRELRNLFAHTYEKVDFDNPKVISLVEKLVSLEEIPGAMDDEKAMRGATHYEKWARALGMKKLRMHFQLSVAGLAGTLHGMTFPHLLGAKAG